MVVSFAETITFERGSFFYGWKESTVKVYDYREKLIEKMIEDLFSHNRGLSTVESRRKLLKKSN